MPASPAMSLPLGRTIRIELPGVPVPKGRPRSRIVIPKAAGKAPFIHFYTPKETEAYEKALAQLARVVMGGKPMMHGPVQVTVVAWVPIPASWSERQKAKAAAGEIRPTTKPDADNYLKTMDALNQIVWWDDSQIVDAQCVKMYSRNPRLTVEVVEL